MSNRLDGGSDAERCEQSTVEFVGGAVRRFPPRSLRWHRRLSGEYRRAREPQSDTRGGRMGTRTSFALSAAGVLPASARFGRPAIRLHGRNQGGAHERCRLIGDPAMVRRVI